MPKVLRLDIYMVGHKGFIAGGVFKNIFTGVKIKDVDIFFLSVEDFNQAVEYYKASEDYVFSYENKNTVAYKNKKTNIRVELIRHVFGTAEEISKFDFSITKFAYFKEVAEDSTEYKLIFHKDFFEHLTNKKLVLEKDIIYPISTFERSYRYNKYGYGLCRESKENLINAIKQVEIIDLSNELYFGID